MLNVTNIPAPRVSIIDEKTGLISREWYRFFLNLFTLVGQGNNQTNLDDLQVGPPSQNINILVAGSATDLAPPAVTPMSVADNQALLPPFAQQSFDDSQAVSPPFVVPSADDSQALLPAAMQIFIDSYANLSPPIIPPGPTSSGTVTSVDVSGGTTGMTFTGGPITSSGTITMSGTLAVANGGTSVTSTPTNGQLLIGNGTNYSLATITAGTNISVTNGAGSITIAATGGTGTVTSVAASGGTTGLTFSGSPITTSGTLTLGGTLAVANGGTGSTTLDGADIVTKTGAQTISGAKTFTSYTNQFLGITYATSDGGTGSNAYFGENTAYATIGGVNGVVLASGSTYPGTSRYVGDAISFRPSTTASYSSGTSIQRWTTVYSQNLDLSGVVAAGTWNGSTISVGYGGTGVTSTPSNGQLLIGNGSGYSVANLTAGTNISISNSSGGITISATSGSGTVTSVSGSGGTTGLTLTGGPITSSGTLTLGGTLAVANGGTGATSLTGAGIVTTTDTQTISGQKNFTSFLNTYAGTTYATTNAYFGENTSYAVIGGVNGVVLTSGATYPGTARYVGDSVSFRPYADASYSLGTSVQRWTAVYAVNGTIQTSDGNEKQQIEELSAAELAVAKRIKGLIRKFKFNDSVAEKGDEARIHFGVIAQEVQEAFAAEGLDASKYGLFCSDTWTTSDGSSQTRLGVRYSELLAFIIAAL